MAEAETAKCASAGPKILTANSLANGEKGFCQRRFHAGETGSGDQKRQPELQVLAHVAVLRQGDGLAPVAGIGKPVVRAAAIHPFLALFCIMVRQRKVRWAIAEPLTDRDTLRIERV